MAIDVHPLLREKEERESADVEEQELPADDAPETPDNLSTPAEGSSEAEEPTAEDATADEPDHFVKLDRRTLYQELARYEREDPDFRNILNSYVGRKAKREYDPELTRLRSELEDLRRDKRLNEIRSMKPEDIEQRFRDDPDFAREYAEIVHAQPVDRQSEEVRYQFRSAIDEALDDALERGLTPQRVEQYRQALEYCQIHKTDEHGFFDHEATKDGQARYLTPAQSIRQLQRFIETDVRGPKTPPPARPEAKAPPAAKADAEAPPPPPKKKPAANPGLAESTPDLTPSGGRTGAITRMSLAEYKAIPPPERMRMFPSTADFEKARRTGQIHD